MGGNILQNGQIGNPQERQDVRKQFSAMQPIDALCQTMDSEFKASIVDVSSSGVFIKTGRPLAAGQEIAMKFMFPKTRKTIMATGQVVRTSYDGVGVRFNIFFKE